MLGNLSLTGIFFVPDDKPPLQQGDIRDFTLTLSHPTEGLSNPLIIKAKGKITQIVITEDLACLGMAVHFLSGPYFG
jgi:hypothetical protein